MSIGNRAGYWYFLKSVEILDEFRRGECIRIKLRWENHGVAPAYHRYRVTAKLSMDGGAFEQILPDLDNCRWIPGSIVEETAYLRIPADLPIDEYSLGIRLDEVRHDRCLPIDIALSEQLRNAEGFYRIVTVKVT